MSDVAVVTGAASGMGQATARLLRERGVAVVGVDLSPGQDADGLAWVGMDVSDFSAWPGVVGVAAERFGSSPSILVLAAASIAVGNVLTLTDEDWRRMYQVNVLGCVNALRVCLPPMIERRRGSIVTVASTNALVAEQGLLAYNASKGAVLMLTRTLAVDHARDGIRANCVCPGATDTPMLRTHIESEPDPEAFVRAKTERIPIGRFLRPEEVARTIVFLACDDSAGMTGAAVPVDGGLTASFDFFATA